LPFFEFSASEELGVLIENRGKISIEKQRKQSRLFRETKHAKLQMSILNRLTGVVPRGAPAKEASAVRTIRFASAKQARKAGAWAIKKYASVFKKLAE